MKKITILGTSWSYMAVIFDVCFETTGVCDFDIYKNIQAEGEPVLFYGTDKFNYTIFEPEDAILSKPGEIVFGVTGPWGKYSVFNDFLKNNIEKSFYRNIIHPGAYVASSVSLLNGTLIEPGSTISSQTKVGFGVSIKRDVSVGHHNILEDFAELNPGVTLSSHVTIGKGSIIGSGAVVKDGISIGKNCIVGMGSVVTKDVPDGVVVFGNPCAVIRKNEKQPVI